jgi:hypothetical protein
MIVPAIIAAISGQATLASFRLAGDVFAATGGGARSASRNWI